MSLSAEPAFATDFAGHARYLTGERVELIDHRVDGFLEQENFTADVHGDFLRQVAAGNGRGHFCDIPNLASQVAGHGVDGVGEIFPGSTNTGHLRLAAQLSVSTDFAGHARYFRCERTQLVHHRVQSVLELENFALHVDRDLARQIAASHGRRHFGNISNLTSQVAGHEVHVIGEILPRAGHAGHLRLAA